MYRPASVLEALIAPIMPAPIAGGPSMPDPAIAVIRGGGLIRLIVQAACETVAQWVGKIN